MPSFKFIPTLLNTPSNHCNRQIDNLLHCYTRLIHHLASTATAAQSHRCHGTRTPSSPNPSNQPARQPGLATHCLARKCARILRQRFLVPTPPPPFPLPRIHNLSGSARGTSGRRWRNLTSRPSSAASPAGQNRRISDTSHPCI